MAHLKPGDAAPPFELIDQNSAVARLSDFAGRKLLLYFYPRADTPGCTRQACSVRDARPDLTRLGIAALGISPDPPARQKRFDDKHGLSFPLLSDPDHTVATAYGVWDKKSLYGKLMMGIKRSSFLIDERGIIIGAWYGIKPEDTIPKALETLGPV
ncbi:thioredoxin-dependent thiol peroxidase [Candidatus Latescibacterota bacterium]